MRLFKKALKRYKIDMLTANEEAGTSRRNSTLLKALTFHDTMQQAEDLDNNDDDHETRKRILKFWINTLKLLQPIYKICLD